MERITSISMNRQFRKTNMLQRTHSTSSSIHLVLTSSTLLCSALAELSNVIVRVAGELLEVEIFDMQVYDEIDL